MKKIAHVKELLHQKAYSKRELMEATGITSATYYSLPYYLGKQGFKITKGENATKEATYQITGASNPAPKKVEAAAPVVAKATKKPRKVMQEALAVV